MLLNSLMISLIAYAISIIYNLTKLRTLKYVFFQSLRLFFLMTFLSFFLQLVIYLTVDIIKADKKVDEFEKASKNQPSSDQQKAEIEAEDSVESEPSNDFPDKVSADEKIENDFEEEIESFSAFDEQEFDFQNQ